MNWRDLFSRLDRVQQGRMFKIIASAVVLLLGVAGFVAYVVAQNVPEAGVVQPGAPAAGAPDEAAAQDADAQAMEKARANAIDATQRILSTIAERRQDATSVGVGIGVGVSLALVVIWLGLALTYLGLVIVGGAMAALAHFVFGWRAVPVVILGCIALTAAFTALMQGVRFLLWPSHPVFAVARNLLNEAARQKVSVVFIVLLILAMAALPTLLDPTQPLRYRVQSFLQYGTGGSFWLIAILTILLCVSSICFEQRDRVIWQTMTKPVAAWQYVLGKWLGAVSLAAVLLAVTCSGVFLFTEYLRSQPATGEDPGQAYVVDGAVAEDRLILETQVLAARKVTKPEPLRIDEKLFQESAGQAVTEEIRRANPNFESMPAADREQVRQETFNRLVGDLRKGIQLQYMSLEPGAARIYEFRGLREAKSTNFPLMFRYKVNAGSNMPDQLYKVSFQFRGSAPRVETVNLAQNYTLRLLPTVIDDEGVVLVKVENRDVLTPGHANTETMSFPPDGMEISYAVSSYRPNFVRVAAVLWVKIAFVAMIAVFASTFLSFPVASMVAFGCFLVAEGAPQIQKALEVYDDRDQKGNIVVARWIIVRIADGVSSLFRIYGDLQPVSRLAEGKLLPWSDVALGTGVLALLTALLFALASYVFSRRELATYSGQ